MDTDFQRRLEELEEEEALKTGDRTAVISHKRWVSKMRQRWHLTDTKEPYPDSICSVDSPLTRLTLDASAVSCPECLAHPEFPAAVRQEILDKFSVLRDEVYALSGVPPGYVEPVALNNLGVMPWASQITGSGSTDPAHTHTRSGVLDAEIKHAVAELNTVFEQPKELGIMSKIGDIFVTAAKRGTAAGVVRGVTKRVTKVLEERYPIVAVIPDDLRNLVVCSIIHMVAMAAQDKPGMSAIQVGAELALEGLVTSVVASTVEEVMNAMTTEMEALAFDTPPKSLAG